ncbi:hypothetical protein ACP275_06G080500 [Erythranthe tilingii]
MSQITRMKALSLFILFIIIIANILQPFPIVQGIEVCVGTKLRRVFVVNGLPEGSNPLTLHCQSGDDDLGNRTLSSRQELDWKFCTNIFGKTLYFCHVWWGSKSAAFDVYNKDIEKNYCFGGLCHWEIFPDGIYSFNVKVHDWNTKHSSSLGF